MEKKKRERRNLEKEMIERKRILSEKERKCNEKRQKNEKLKENYRKKLIERINSSDEKIKKQIEDNLKLSQEKFIELTMRQEDIENNIKDKERAYQFMRKK